MSDLAGYFFFTLAIGAAFSAIATPIVLMCIASRLEQRLFALEEEVAALDWDLNGPNPPAEGEPDQPADNVIAFGKRTA